MTEQFNKDAEDPRKLEVKTPPQTDNNKQKPEPTPAVTPNKK